MSFYNDLSRYQTIVNHLKQSKIDPDFLKLYDEIYTNVCSDKYLDVTHEYNRLDILIYLLIEAYHEYLSPEDEHFAEGYQDYFAHLLDTTIIQKDAKTTYRQMLLDTATLLKLNRFIQTSDQFSSTFLNAQYPSKRKG